jgi:molecular chaperone GrpE
MVPDDEPAVSPVVPPEREPSAPAAAPVAEVSPSDDLELRFKYLFADFENFRRRSERDREQARREGRVGVLRHLLPLLEASERATEAARTLAPTHPLRTGLDLLAREWEALQKAEHLAPVARVADPFRSEEHEAVAEVVPPPHTADGAVVEIIQQGYRCDAGLIRAAKVVVARVPPPGPQTEPAETAPDPSFP